MVSAIWLIRRKVMLLNRRYGGTVHKAKLNEPVVGVHILVILVVSVTYFWYLPTTSYSSYYRADGVINIFDGVLSLLLSAIITNIIQMINFSRALEAEAQEEWQIN